MRLPHALGFCLHAALESARANLHHRRSKSFLADANRSLNQRNLTRRMARAHARQRVRQRARGHARKLR